MMLCKLSLKNITKSIKDYAIYFFTLILGVAIFYVFNSIESQSAMIKISKSTYDIIGMMTSMLSGVSIFVSLILGFLIIYASRFLIKRRNKEFGIYLTLGMSKRKISFILLLETLFIGVISLIVGLGVGIILSQFMSIFICNMFEARMDKFHFVFSTSASIKTTIYFCIMFLVVMLFNTISVSKCKLIDLINYNKKSEKVKIKNPYISIIVFIISVSMLVWAYYKVTIGVNSIMTDSLVPVITVMVVGAVGTLLFFWSVSGFILKLVMKLKGIYYKDLNSFVLRQISSKVNTAVFSMTIICLMLFVTICLLSSALSIKNFLSSNLEELAPVDIQLIKRNEPQYYDKKERELANQNTIEKVLNDAKIDYNSVLKDITIYSIYHEKGLTLYKTLGESLKEVEEQYAFMLDGQEEDIVKLSEYNRIAELYGHEKYTLEENQYLILCDYSGMKNVRDLALKNNEKININNKELEPKYDVCMDGFIDIAGSHCNGGIIVVNDSLISEYKSISYGLLANYKVHYNEDKDKIEEDIIKTFDNTEGIKHCVMHNTKIEIATASVGLSILVTFISMYLGIIFLISSAAILALKELSESTDNIERYSVLRRIGADEKIINRALFRQIGIFFLFPLVLAIVHSVIGIKFCSYLLQTVIGNSLLSPIISTALILIFIYGGYFLITYYCSKNIIKEK